MKWSAESHGPAVLKKRAMGSLRSNSVQDHIDAVEDLLQLPLGHLPNTLVELALVDSEQVRPPNVALANYHRTCLRTYAPSR